MGKNKNARYVTRALLRDKRLPLGIPLTIVPQKLLCPHVILVKFGTQMHSLLIIPVRLQVLLFT